MIPHLVITADVYRVGPVSAQFVDRMGRKGYEVVCAECPKYVCPVPNERRARAEVRTHAAAAHRVF